MSSPRTIPDIRILFHPGAIGADLWARALNETHWPYCFISHEELERGLDPAVRLLICPNVSAVSDAELSTVRLFMEHGGTVLATAPFARRRPSVAPAPVAIPDDGKAVAEPIKSGEPAKQLVPSVPQDRIQSLFGIRWTTPASVPGKPSDDEAACSGIPAAVSWTTAANAGSAVSNFTGTTLGEYGLEVVEPGRVAAGYARLGDCRPGETNQPGFIGRMFAAPAIVEARVGEGRGLYLTFQPDTAVLARWLGALTSAAGIPVPDFRVNQADGTNATVYLYPFTCGVIRMVGVIQDYWRVPPAFQVEGGKQTALYYHHGPQVWIGRKIALESVAPAHWYDVRGGRYLGHTQQLEFELMPGRPELFAFLPYRVLGLEIKAPSTIAQGQIAQIVVELQTEGGTPGDHVVHVALTDPSGRQSVADRYNLHTRAGKGTLRVPMALNAATGVWSVAVSDAITGFSHRQALVITPGAALEHALPHERTEVCRTPLAWPQGRLANYVPDTPAATQAVAHVAPLTRFQNKRSSAHLNHWSLSADAQLINSRIEYGLAYSVCNDAAAHNVEDARRIWAPYPPGLGFRTPNASSWYYNGYIDVRLDDFRVSDYAIRDWVAKDAGRNARFDAVWDTPRGEVRLAFVLMPDHQAVFQELMVTAARDMKDLEPVTVKPIERLTVCFSSYLGGFIPPSQKVEYVTTDPVTNAWALMGERYGKGPGPCAILVLPEELESVKYGSGTTLTRKMKLAPGESVSLHWALWMFPDISNAKALRYMNDSAADTRRRLQDLFKETSTSRKKQ